MPRYNHKLPKEQPLSVTFAGEVLEATGTEPEGSIRHQESPLAEVPERDPNQTIPGQVDVHAEPGMAPTTVKFWQPTEHRSR